MKLLVLALAAIAFTNASALAVWGEVRTVTGTLEWPRTLADERFIIVRAEDGTPFFIDISAARRASGQVLNAGDRVSVSGIEGAQPYVVQAAVLGLGDSAVSGTPAPQAGAPPAAAPEPPSRRFDGRVEAVSESMLRLRTNDGRTVVVDIARLTLHETLKPGAAVTVFGFQRPDGRFVASGYVQQEEPGESALPRQRR